MQAIKIPTHCPSCNAVLKWNSDLLFCTNSLCDSQLGKKIEHFAKTLKIKGLGPAAIAKLNLRSISDLYNLDETIIATALSSKKLAGKLFYEIGNSTNANLNRLLPAFAIPLVGTSASGKLAAVCNDIHDINDETCKQAGLGPKTSKSLLDWIEDNLLLLEELPFSFKFEKPKVQGNRGVVCISGKLKSFKTKAEATEVLKELGYTVKSSFTKDVTILINEGGVESAKTKQARESGVTIVTNLNDFIGEI